MVAKVTAGTTAQSELGRAAWCSRQMAVSSATGRVEALVKSRISESGFSPVGEDDCCFCCSCFGWAIVGEAAAEVGDDEAAAADGGGGGGGEGEACVLGVAPRKGAVTASVSLRKFLILSA